MSNTSTRSRRFAHISELVGELEGPNHGTAEAHADGSAVTKTHPPERIETAEARSRLVVPSAPAAQEPAQNESSGGKRADPKYRQVSAYLARTTHLAVQKRLLDEYGDIRRFSDLVQVLLEGWLADNYVVELARDERH